MNKIIVQSSEIAGKGLFAKNNIFKGEIVGFFQGRETYKDHVHVLWTSSKKGIRVRNNLRFANHNWINPNAQIITKNNKYALKAINDIKKGSEITWDYSVGYAYDSKMEKGKPLFDENNMSIIYYNILNNDFNNFKRNLRYIKKNHLLNKIEYKWEGLNISLFDYISGFGSIKMFNYYLELFNLPWEDLYVEYCDKEYDFFYYACLFNNVSLLKFLLENLDDCFIHIFITKEKFSQEISYFPLSNFLHNIDKKMKKDEFLVLNKWVKLSKKNKDFSFLYLYTTDKGSYHLYDFLLDNNYINEFFRLVKSEKLKVCYLLRSRSYKKIYKNLSKIDYSKVSFKDLKYIISLHKLSSKSKYLKEIIRLYLLENNIIKRKNTKRSENVIDSAQSLIFIINNKNKFFNLLKSL